MLERAGLPVEGANHTGEGMLYQTPSPRAGALLGLGGNIVQISPIMQTSASHTSRKAGSIKYTQTYTEDPDPDPDPSLLSLFGKELESV